MSRTAIYFVQVQGSKGRYFVERDPANMNFADTVADIADGQIEDVVSVVECDPENFWSEDATRKVAGAVIEKWAHSRNEPLTERQYNFVEQFGSIKTARCFRRAA